MARSTEDTDRLKRMFRKLLKDGLLRKNQPRAEPERSFEVVTSVEIDDFRYAIVKCPNRPNRPLSRREMQVAWLVAQNFISKQIADILGIKHSTVLTHIKNIFNKLGIRSRIGLVYHFLFMDEDFLAIEKSRRTAKLQKTGS